MASHPPPVRLRAALSRRKFTRTHQGPQGPTGPSNGFHELVLSAPIGTDWTQVASLTFPQGAYIVSAKLYATTNGPNIPATVVSCGLSVGNGNGAAYDYSKGTISSDASGPVLGAATAVTNAWCSYLDRAHVRCKAPVPALANWIAITAVRVESMTNA